MADNAKAMVLASFIGDSLALPAHWIYDTIQIESKFGRVETFMKPDPTSYHPTKDAGEFTHYGDQALVLLNSIADRSGFDPNHFAESWRRLFSDYKGYIDKATRGTLQNLSQGATVLEAGSSSSDLAGAARIAPLVYRYRESLEELIHHARTQTAMTHNNPLVIESAEFFARLTWEILNGLSPREALSKMEKENFHQDPFSHWITHAVNTSGTNTQRVISQFGQSCDTRGAFPSVIHLIAHHENDLKEALIENVMAGGDSAARGMVVGMVLGAYLGMEAIPGEWMENLKQYRHIMDLLNKIKP